METFYKISLNIKTVDGFESYLKFDLISDREKAIAEMELLTGTEDVTEESVIYMDLTASRNSHSSPVRILHCTRNDIAHNVRIIREVASQILISEK